MKHLDKIAHFSVSFVIVACLNVLVGMWLALIITLAVGVCKELYDQYSYGGFSCLDLLADVSGILTFYIFYHG
jgi:hypothetical protein